MNASGNIVLMTYGGSSYYFDELRITVTSRIESTPLVGGGSIRVRAGGAFETITLKGRTKSGELFKYESLLRELAEGVISGLTINGRSYDGYTLMSGRIISAEGCVANTVEIVLTEADE